MTVENTLHIDAAPEVVWAVTADVDRWPEWLPTVSSVRRLDTSPFGLGSKALVKQPAQAEAEWVVTDFVAGERFTWQTQRAGLQMVATHELRPEGPGTSNVLRVEASGVLATLFSPVLRPLFRRALAEENRSLKKRCAESAAASRSHG